MEQEVFEDLLDSISTNIQLMFNAETSPVPESHVSQRPDFENDFICMISLANQSFQGQLVIGFNEKTVNTILAEVMTLVSTEEEKFELLRASLGELLNTIGGDFAQKESARKAYEWLDLSTPSVWEKNCAPFFCKSEGLSGKLMFGDDDINTYLTVSPYKILTNSDDGIDISDFLDDDLDDLLSGL